MKKFFKEPLLHFIVLGALIYVASMTWGNIDDQQQNIVISQGKIRHLATLFMKTWQRSPTQKELENVVQEYVIDQAGYLEGVKLGLDKNDIVITRRIRQKLEFIAEENSPPPQVTDELLAEYLDENSGQFRLEPKLTIRQVFLDPQKHGDATYSTAEKILQQLRAKPEQDITKLGDRYLFKPLYQHKSLTELGRVFGRDFTINSAKLSTGSWYGPIRSGFGVHLAYIEKRQDGKLPKLSEIRSQVERELENSWKKRSTKKYYDELLSRYIVTIHWLDDDKGSGISGQQTGENRE